MKKIKKIRKRKKTKRRKESKKRKQEKKGESSIKELNTKVTTKEIRIIKL